MFDIDSVKTLSDYQQTTFYRAKVISLDDPLKLNRIQIMIYGLTDDFETPENVEDSPQPWCEFQFRDGIITYPNEGDIIWLFFEGGDIFRPVYLGTIYAGLDATDEEGLKKLLAERTTKVENIEQYKESIKRLNGENIIATDAHQAFTNFMLTEDDLPFQIFDGDNTRGEVIDHQQRQGEIKDDDLSKKYKKDGSDFKATAINWGHYRSYPDIPETFDVGKPMYVWYKTETITEEETKAGITWKNKVGGWTFLRADEVQNALMAFPDNLKHFNYNRFQKWKKTVEGNRFDWSKEVGNISGFDKQLTTIQQQWMWNSDNPNNTIQGTPGAAIPFHFKEPKKWEFIPDYPWHFWQPEQTCDGGIWNSYLFSFPFGKMNLETRKYWKQHTIMSHDYKSVIELDDNDNYERLAMIFDHGSGGLEFSHAGMNGLDIWTDGVFHLHAGNKTNGDNQAPKENWMMFPGGSVNIIAQSSSLTATREASVFATGDVSLVGKLGTATIMANNGISLSSWGGMMVLDGKSTESNIAQNVDTRGIWFGNPIISCPKDKKSDVGSGFQGLFLCLPTSGGDNAAGSITDSEAEEWINYFNSALMALKQLFTKLSSTIAPGQLPSLAAFATKWVGQLKKWDIDSKTPCSAYKLGQAWSKIVIQGARS